MAERRAAFNGRCGYLEQVWRTHEALEQRMDSIHEPYLTCLMSILGVREVQRRFARRPAPPIMETTSKPVLRIPMSFVELTRESDPNDPKMKVIIKREDCVLNSKNPLVSTDMHPLARYPLYQGGCANADWCVKHCLATAVKQKTNKSKSDRKSHLARHPGPVGGCSVTRIAGDTGLAPDSADSVPGPSRTRVE
jgi:hypothetical protein